MPERDLVRGKAGKTALGREVEQVQGTAVSERYEKAQPTPLFLCG